MINIPYQKIFIGIITLLSSVFLVLSIKDNVTTAIIFHSVVILCAVVYYAVEYFHSKKQSQKQIIPIQSVMKQFFTYITSIKSYLSYIFLFFLILITVGSLQFDFIQNISILDSIVSFLSKHSILLTIFAIISGGLTFWIHKEEIETSEEQELMQEEQAEKTRSQEFATKYPRINSIPVIRNIIRWMYVEEWWYGTGLIFVFIIFVGIRLHMLRFSGNYPDEFNHILSGIHLFEYGTLPQLVTYTESWQYTRGIHISFITGLFMFLFGKTLTVAKLVPITLGIINFLMISNIAKKLIKNKTLILIYLSLFSFLSWSIFNHFYIRGYVFTEFSLIALLFLSFKIIDYFKNKISLLKTIAMFILMVFTTFINFYFSNDATTYLIPIAFFFQLLFLYYLFITKKYNKLAIFLNLSQKRMRNFFYVIPVLAISIFSITNMQFLQEKINLLLYGGSNSGVNHIDFNEFFFDINLIFTTLAILSFILVFFINNKKIKLLFVTILPLLFLHGISSTELQVIRGMMYIFPLFYLSSFIVLDKLPKLNPRLIFSSLTIIIITSFIPIINTNYDLVFDNGYPVIPNEIGYHEYSKQHESMKNLRKNYDVFFAADFSVARQELFGFEHNYKLDFLSTLKGHYRDIVHDDGVMRQLFTNTPVINDFKIFKDIVEKEKVCVTLKPFSKKYFLGNIPYDYIIKNFRIIDEGINYKIYCN